MGLSVYVDGSFNVEKNKYGYGCVFVDKGEVIFETFGGGNDPESIKQRNVSGEMLGAMYAVRWAMKQGYKSLDIYYDYAGIEYWVTGAWKAKTDHTKKYAEAMRDWGKSITLAFHKVEAHTGVEFNERADKLAKQGAEMI